jgi:glycosyltransferase A (GT-A) superfamily protein (DUF2064 family)
MCNKTAILIFTNSAEADSRNKKILNGEKVFNSLNASVFKKAKKTLLPTIVLSTDAQRGNSFGERFYNAFTTVFDYGFDNIIAIGNDTPQLTTQLILSAHHALKTEKITIGPSLDGGFYLLGIDKSTFLNLNFTSLSWQTPKLFSQIFKRLQESEKETKVLRRLSDIDHLNDLKIIQNLSKNISLNFKAIISQIFKKYDEFYDFKWLLSLNIYLSIPQNKGSPALG